jgi:5-methylcytosine-specific restriction endonuclease McrA
MTLRAEVEQRARGRCEYCQSQARYSTQTFALEHIVPRIAGGKTTLDNLALACQGCNNHKYSKTYAPDPATNHVVLLFHPRRHAWEEHFAWDASFERIVGLTSTGRATVETLHLNRDELINLRRLLYAAGEHPPLAEETHK